MRDMRMRASITGYRSFGDLRSLLRKIPLLQDNMEDLGVEGWGLDVPRFHLVPFELHTPLPTIQSLALRGGLVYMPTVFLVSLRRFEHLVRLFLNETTFISVHDLRRMLESLRGLRILTLRMLGWLSYNPGRLLSNSCTQPPHSRLRLEALEIFADAKWVTDTRSIVLLDWLSASGAISEIHQLRPGNFVLVDKVLVATMGKMLCAAQKSPNLSSVSIHCGPDVDWAPCEFLFLPGCFTANHAAVSVHAPLGVLPQLRHLRLTCPYDAASLSHLTDCLFVTLSRPKEIMHMRLFLRFDRYLPHHATEPPTELWERLDRALQSDGLERVGIDRRVHICSPAQRVIWGDWYNFERSDEWLAEARVHFPKVCKSGRLWAQDTRRGWHHIQCGLSPLLLCTLLCTHICELERALPPSSICL